MMQMQIVLPRDVEAITCAIGTSYVQVSEQYRGILFVSCPREVDQRLLQRAIITKRVIILRDAVSTETRRAYSMSIAFVLFVFLHRSTFVASKEEMTKCQRVRVATNVRNGCKALS